MHSRMYCLLISVILLVGALLARADQGRGSDSVTKKQSNVAPASETPDLHGVKGFGSDEDPTDFPKLARFKLVNSLEGDRLGHFVQATPDQRSLFQNWASASNHFYELTRINSYLLSAKGNPAADLSRLQASAAAMFEVQQEFVGNLTDTQRQALSSRLRFIDKFRHDSETRLNWLAARTELPSGSTSYFKAITKLKSDVERLAFEQEEIALKLRIHSAVTERRNSWYPHWGVPAFGWRPKNR